MLDAGNKPLRHATKLADNLARLRKIESPVLAKAFYGTAILLALTVAVATLATTIGPFNIPLPNALTAILVSIGMAEGANVSPAEQAIVETVRIPRVAMAVAVGTALATAGALMQAIFRNPLADPGIIGTSAGGALGAVIVLSLGIGATVIAVPIAASIGAAAALGTVIAIAGIWARFSIAALLLTGVAVSAFLSAAVSAIILSTDSVTAQREMIFWLAGGLEGATWTDTRVVIAIASLGVAAAVALSRDLNLLVIGDIEAQSLGLRVKRFRIGIALLASILTAVAVAFTGIIAFVGLVVPHAVRLVVGADHRHVVLLSALAGGLFLLIADTAARSLISPGEIRVGIITSLIGGPLFIALLIASRDQIGGSE